MGRPLKIKISDTQDAGFNNPTGGKFYGVVGGDTSTSDYTFPVTKVRIRVQSEDESVAVAEEDGYILKQKGSTKYLVSGTAEKTALAEKIQYRITTVGNTAWTSYGVSGTAEVGDIFEATAALGDTGTGRVTQVGTCVLANKADAALAAGEMTVTVTLPDSSEVRLSKMTNKWGLNFNATPTSRTRYLLNFFDVSDDTVEKSGAEGTTTTVDLAQVDNPNLYG